MARGQRLVGDAFAAILLVALGGAAAAQERDPAGVYDTRDVLGRLPHSVDNLPTKENDRNDTVAALVLIAERKLARTWTLGWEAACINRFSNRARSRFQSFDLAIELGRRF